MNSLLQDLRYAVRCLRKQALLSVVVIATLTLGIGVSTGAFTYYNSEFLRARVDKDFDSFVRVYSAYSKDPARPGRPGQATLADYRAFREQAKSLRNLAAYAQVEMHLGEDDPVEVRALLVTENFFALYDLEQPLMGRLLLAEDCAAASPVVVLSERLWRNHYAADPKIVGRVIHFNGQPVTVVGVAPPFAGMINNSRAWLPYSLENYLKLGDHMQRPSEAGWLMVEGRLNQGFSRRDAAEELKLIASQQDRLHTERLTTLTVTDGSSIQEPGARYVLSWAISLIIGALTIFVLIVCVNVTTLLLSRAAARRHEIAIRLAMGAGRGRLIRMLLTETFMLAAIAGIISLDIVYTLPDLMRQWLINSRGDLHDAWSLAPDWRVFGYMALITFVAGAMAGLTPALQSLKINLSEMLKSRDQQSGRAGRPRAYAVLIGAQVALSFFLLWWIGIAVRTYQKTATFETGYDARHVLVTSLWLQTKVSEARAWSAVHRNLGERLRALPGVEAVAFSDQEPFHYQHTINLQTAERPAQTTAMSVVSPSFFSALQIPIVRGQAFGEADPDCNSPSCYAVVSERLARDFWPNEDPVGKRLRTPGGYTFEVIGVAGDVSLQRLGGPDDPMIYLPWDANAFPHHAFLRFSGDGAALEREVAALLKEVAPQLSFETWTVQAIVDWHFVDLGRMVLLIVFLGVIAVGLALIGIYGVVTFAVTQRTREMGIRLALGAQKQDIYATILKGNVRPVVAGLVVGAALTLTTVTAAAQVLRAQPFALSVRDPIIYVVTAILLAAVALLAMLIPARRAARLEPMDVLRCE
ncbi:MAG TPA: ADOP family duplicated permease [Blastocatellia bacterium]|nr:ADOP family duplicated permease [Blastocatellia bacterium]